MFFFENLDSLPAENNLDIIIVLRYIIKKKFLDLTLFSLHENNSVKLIFEIIFITTPNLRVLYLRLNFSIIKFHKRLWHFFQMNYSIKYKRSLRNCF
jgi:hypothetical protein